MVIPAVLLVVAQTAAQEAPERASFHAVRAGTPIVLDGSLTDPAWELAQPITEFHQRDPQEGAAPTERTEVRFAYDDEALYVGARMYDQQPDAIVARLGRRDAWLNADAFQLYLDPYHDRRSGFFFVVNAAGTLRDGTLFNDDWDDDSWDGVWQARVKRDAQGWTAEMRIPYSQLRFHAGDAYRWGVNCRRYIGRNKEDDYVVFTPKTASGFVSRFPELVGLEGVVPPRRVAVTPYSTTKAEYRGTTQGDPFNDGSRIRPALGADAKVGIGTNLTLDATVNPDFGQVEVDPAVVNLSDVETFYDEKRPFFVEGSSTFRFGQGGASNYVGFNWPNPDFFYSRRIGRAPQGSLPPADFSDVPSGVTILGAAKVSGKLGDHWNLGTLHALTSRETADVAFGNVRSQPEVEPKAYYGLLRLQRDFPENRHGIGMIATAVSRDFQSQHLRDQLDAKAFALGVDGWTFLGSGKTWVLSGWAGVSDVRGSSTRIGALQRSAQHYFQRPDAGHVGVDPDATSLTGNAARVWLNKEKGNVMFNAGLGYISPGFDVNDMGFLWRADLINSHVWGGYRWTNPGTRTRSAGIEGAVFRSYDFDGNKTWDGVFVAGNVQLLNYARISSWVAYNPETVSTTRTRGGPTTLNPAGWEWDAATRSDDRSDFWARVGVHGWDYGQNGNGRSLGLGVQWRPRGSVELTLEPQMEWRQEGAQWVGAFPDPAAVDTFGTRYVFARMEQKTFSAGVRLNWTFTPRLSLQVYAQPLISAGDYADFGELARPRSFSFTRYAPGAAPVPLPNPDFNFKSLRGNAVLRWEYRPGSTLFAVWTQNRADVEDAGAFRFGRSVGRLLDSKADNIFLLKMTYWWSR